MSLDQIKKVAVIGAGDMGHGIAEVALLAGYPVTLYDINTAAVEKGAARILASLEKLEEKGKVPAAAVEQIRSQLLKTTTDLAEAAGTADLVIEAIPEVLDLKRRMFVQLDELAPPHALLASNTSTMSITEIGASTKRPAQVLGLHFFNPAVLMKLVEVIRSQHTSDATIQTGYAFGQKIGKVPVLVRRDTPGFIANRVTAASTALVQTVVESGEIEPEALDAFLMQVGMPMGPCELTDYVGIDVMVHVCRYFAEQLHPDYAPAPHLVRMFEQGHLGKKSGQGYYDWSSGRPQIDRSQATKRFHPLLPIFVQINEATKLVEDGVCSVADVDLAMIHSTGNPVGPMSIGRQISHWDLTDQLERLAARYHKSIFQPTQRVREGGHKH
ncbi:MAG: 3-hydroxyacyl-CoA dehydrogenase NAD-binding domain-containing protein [Planctomycetaceae bacterium]